MLVILKIPDDEKAFPHLGKSNNLAHGILSVVRMPPEGEVVPAKVGDRIEGRVVLQYLGPLTITILKDRNASQKKSAHSKSKSKRSLDAAGARPKDGETKIHRSSRRVKGSV